MLAYPGTFSFILTCEIVTVLFALLLRDLSRQNQSVTSFSDESVVLLTLYEFEAKAQLGDSDLSLCLDTAQALSHADASTFETLAGNKHVHSHNVDTFLQ